MALNDAAPAAPANDPAQEQDQIQVLDLLAHVYLQNRMPDKAAVLLAARNLLAPGDRRALLALALAQLRSEKPQRALNTLEQLALLGAMDAPFHLVRAQALHALGKTDEAASAMRAYVALRPSSPAPAGASSAAPRTQP
jgi:Flp pilus assembly protein TadD